MDWQELDKAVAAGRIAPVYLFSGNEGYLLELALNNLKEKLLPPEAAALDYQEFNGRELAAGDIALLADTLPALAERRLVVVKNPAPEVLKDGGEALLAYLANPAATTCLVLVVDGNIDKRLKLVKLIQQTGQVVEFLPLKGPDLEKWLQREAGKHGYSLQPAAARLLAQACGDLRRAVNELFKVMTWMGAGGTITAKHVEALLPEAAAEATVFQLVDALGNRKAAPAIKTLRRLLDRGEVPLGIVAMLARQLRLIYQYHLAGCGRQELAARLGVKPFVAQKVAAQAHNFSLPAVRLALEELLKVDTAIKSGQGPPGLLLEQAIWNIIKK
ncbi:MAG: DNA polymerase III subunit delta [Moorella sp. (in: Bacteria)]|nr:DNA polymerase III subunit delta [Moorella sp. (in: firmicutes)]